MAPVADEIKIQEIDRNIKFNFQPKLCHTYLTQFWWDVKFGVSHYFLKIYYVPSDFKFHPFKKTNNNFACSDK